MASLYGIRSDSCLNVSVCSKRLAKDYTVTTAAGKKESEPGGAPLPGRGPGTRLVNRMLSRNQRRPLTVRLAMRGIMVATITSVLVGGVVVLGSLIPRAFPASAWACGLPCKPLRPWATAM